MFNHGTTNKEYSDYDILKNRSSSIGIPMPEVVYEGVFNFSMDDLLKLADSLNYDNGKPCEGIVIRPINEMYSNVMKGRMSFKVLNNDFLVKNKE